MQWDPNQYLAFADERALPFHHLVAAVIHPRPRRVLDIGCGPGALTATLLDRWPSAEFLGIDSSTEMIELAERRAVPIASASRWPTSDPGDRKSPTTSFCPTPVSTGLKTTPLSSESWCRC